MEMNVTIWTPNGYTSLDGRRAMEKTGVLVAVAIIMVLAIGFSFEALLLFPYL